MESDPCCGRSATSRTPENVECAQVSFSKDQRLTVLTVRELEADLGILKTTMSEVFTQNFDMKCIIAKFIPRLLLPEQKEHCASVANDLIQTAASEPDFLEKAITGYAWWVYGYNPEAKVHA